jgi:nicotinate-nucleotide adenylyltransferase
VSAITPTPDFTARAIGVLGGTFDPVHHAHLFTAEVAAAAGGLERVLLVPASQSPLKGRASGTL